MGDRIHPLAPKGPLDVSGLGFRGREDGLVFGLGAF